MMAVIYRSLGWISVDLERLPRWRASREAARLFRRHPDVQMAVRLYGALAERG